MSLQLHSTIQLDIYLVCSSSQLEIPVVSAGIAAGFPLEKNSIKNNK